jgi:hypothetical protein
MEDPSPGAGGPFALAVGGCDGTADSASHAISNVARVSRAATRLSENMV